MMDVRQVFGVTCGAYSDYEVHVMLSTREEAQRVVDARNAEKAALYRMWIADEERTSPGQESSWRKLFDDADTYVPDRDMGAWSIQEFELYDSADAYLAGHPRA